MDFDFTDEQRAFAREEWLPQAPGWDERGEFPVEALRRAAALGLAGIYVGEEFGGSGSAGSTPRSPSRNWRRRARPAAGA